MAPAIRAAAGHCPGSRCRWRPICPGCSPRVTCVTGRSNAAQRPSARDQWPWRSSTSGWRRWAVTEPPAVASPAAAVSLEFAGLASDEQLATAAAALQANGIRPLLAATGADARDLVRSLLTDGAEVYNNTSQTLEANGVADDIERSGRYQPLRLRLYRMDREMQGREMRALAASPDYVVGSVHALTEDGSLLIASASGSDLGRFFGSGVTNPCRVRYRLIVAAATLIWWWCCRCQAIVCGPASRPCPESSFRSLTISSTVASAIACAGRKLGQRA